ncbi:hypothetical protein SLE2022_257700 [Rubroshorea leprosula]
MKGFTITSSSAKSSTTTVEDCRSETRDSCYYPGCQKDANCNCEMCLASINATLDLMPISVQKSSFTKLSSPLPNVERTPITFDPSVMSTPRSSSCPAVESPVLKSTARCSLQKEEESTKKEGAFGGVLRWFLLGLTLFFVVEFGFPWVVSGVLRPVLTRETVKSIGERSTDVKDLNAKLRFLQNELKGFVHGKVSNCSNTDSIWEINQDGPLLYSHCILYKSAVEEVRIWGWPLQTAGLLTIGSSSRSFTIISGGVIEWLDGNVGFSTRKANASWLQGKWGASVVQLDPNTWILEYRQSLIMENSRLFSVAFDLLKHRVSRLVRRMNEEFWLFSALEYQISGFAAKEHLKTPT